MSSNNPKTTNNREPVQFTVPPDPCKVQGNSFPVGGDIAYCQRDDEVLMECNVTLTFRAGQPPVWLRIAPPGWDEAAPAFSSIQGIPHRLPSASNLWADILATVNTFKDLCVTKLRKRRQRYGNGRYGWLNAGLYDLMDHLEDEVREANFNASVLQGHVEQGYGGSALMREEVEAFIEECCDIANMAMMCADKAAMVYKVFGPWSVHWNKVNGESNSEGGAGDQ